jgi:hypothetical protein
MGKNKSPWIAVYNELMMQYCRPFISDAELNRGIRIVCKEIGSRCFTTLPKTEIVDEILDNLVKNKKISPRAAQTFKDHKKPVLSCCVNVYKALLEERLKAHIPKPFEA